MEKIINILGGLGINECDPLDELIDQFSRAQVSLIKPFRTTAFENF